MWLKPPDKFVLNKNETHIWCADLNRSDLAEKDFTKVLSRDESERASKFRFSVDCKRFIARRGILRLLVGEYIKMSPEKVVFQYGEQGKPFVSGNSAFHFNLSHSENIILFAFTEEHELGIDVEYTNRMIELKEIATRFFSPNETKVLLNLSEKHQPKGFFNCWTRKEAFIKAVGQGLSFPLDEFEVSLKPSDEARLIATHWNPDDVDKWSLRSFEPAEKFVGAIAVKGKISEIKFYKFDRQHF